MFLLEKILSILVARSAKVEYPTLTLSTYVFVCFNNFNISGSEKVGFLLISYHQATLHITLNPGFHKETLNPGFHKEIKHIEMDCLPFRNTRLSDIVFFSLFSTHSEVCLALFFLSFFQPLSMCFSGY
jgi:hypothetical protein